MGPWTRNIVLGQFWKLGFCLVQECENFAHRGQLCKFLDYENVAIVTIRYLLKHACMTHQNAILMHGFNSMPHVWVQQVSSKSCRRWASTCHKMMNVDWIDKPLTPLDFVHRDSAMSGPLLWADG